MDVITPEVQCTPRKLFIDITNKESTVWWEVGNNGEVYQTSLNPKYCAKLIKKKAKIAIIQSQRFEVTINGQD